MKQLIKFTAALLLLVPIIGNSQVTSVINPYPAPVVVEGGSSYASLLADGNTQAVYIGHSDYISDTPGYVTQWADSTGQHDLDVIPGVYTDDLIFAGDSVYTANFTHGIISDTFTLDQPCIVYAVLSPHAWTDNAAFWCGNSASTGRFRQDVSANDVYAYAGNTVGPVGINIYEKVIVRVLYNGTSSKIQVNEETAVTGDIGSSNLGGFALFGRGDGIGDVQLAIWKVIIRSGVDTDENQMVIVNQLNGEFTVY